MKRLQNKVAIITGGTTHLAIRTAKLFLDEGANVVLVDNNKEALEKVISQIGNERLKFCVADTTLSRSVQNYVNRTVEIFGKIDIFFNHADTEDFFAPLTTYPEAVFDHVIATHLKGAWLGNKYVVPHMNHGGSIVMTSSVAGLFGYANLSALVASEHAVVGIMRATAIETEEKQIRVNTVHPSIDSTQAHRGNSVDYLASHAQKSIQPTEKPLFYDKTLALKAIAELVLYLACPESAAITGTTQFASDSFAN